MVLRKLSGHSRVYQHFLKKVSLSINWHLIWFRLALAQVILSSKLSSVRKNTKFQGGKSIEWENIYAMLFYQELQTLCGLRFNVMKFDFNSENQFSWSSLSLFMHLCLGVSMAVLQLEPDLINERIKKRERVGRSLPKVNLRNWSRSDFY